MSKLGGIPHYFPVFLIISSCAKIYFRLVWPQVPNLPNNLKFATLIWLKSLVYTKKKAFYTKFVGVLWPTFIQNFMCSAQVNNELSLSNWNRNTDCIRQPCYCSSLLKGTAIKAVHFFWISMPAHRLNIIYEVASGALPLQKFARHLSSQYSCANRVTKVRNLLAEWWEYLVSRKSVNSWNSF
jgi:hypothetical protein